MNDVPEPGSSLPGGGALAQAPAGADVGEALQLDVPELAGLAGEDSGSDELCETAPPPTARVAAEARIGAKRRPLSHLTRLEFLTDLIHFLRQNGDGNLVSSAAGSNPYWFPEKKLNGRQLDLFSLYRQVVSRGGFYIRSGNRHPFSWSGDIFPNMKHNYTRNHRATSVGHDLIKYYQTFLADYETAHPDDVSPFVAGASTGPPALLDGDRIQVWSGGDAPVWQVCVVSAVVRGAEGNAEVPAGAIKATVTFEDGRVQTIPNMTDVRWRRDRVPAAAPVRRPRPAGGGGVDGNGQPVLPDGSKRKRGGQGAHFWRDYVPTDSAFAQPGGHPPGTGPVAAPLFAALGPGEAEVATYRQRQQERSRALGLVPVTRRSAALFAACDGRRQLGPAHSVAEWLHQRSFGALAPLFAAHEVDLEVLPLLTGEDLEDIGVADKQQRLELLVYVTAEFNGRVASTVLAEVEGLSTRAGERLAGVNDGDDGLVGPTAEEEDGDDCMGADIYMHSLLGIQPQHGSQAAPLLTGQASAAERLGDMEPEAPAAVAPEPPVLAEQAPVAASQDTGDVHMDAE